MIIFESFYFVHYPSFYLHPSFNAYTFFTIVLSCFNISYLHPTYYLA